MEGWDRVEGGASKVAQPPRAAPRLRRGGGARATRRAGASARAAPPAAAPAGVERAARALLRWNDPRHHYLHCLCDAP